MVDVLELAPAAWTAFPTAKVRANLTGHSLHHCPEEPQNRKYLFGDCRNPWVAGTWQRLKRRTDYAGSVLEGCLAEKTADIFPARGQHFGVWHECGS